MVCKIFTEPSGLLDKMLTSSISARRVNNNTLFQEERQETCFSARQSFSLAVSKFIEQTKGKQNGEEMDRASEGGKTEIGQTRQVKQQLLNIIDMWHFLIKLFYLLRQAKDIHPRGNDVNTISRNCYASCSESINKTPKLIPFTCCVYIMMRVRPRVHT